MAVSDTNVQSPLDVARELAPLVRSYAAQIEQASTLPAPLFEALADARLFHLMIPRSLGGSEVDLPTYVRVIEEIGKADASTAWCINQGTVFATYAARMAPALAKKIWVDTPRSVVANAPLPDAVAEVVAGGYRVSGRLSFS